MQVLHQINLKRFSIQFLIGSLLLAAILAIYALLSGKFGDIETRILITTVVMTAFSISLLAHSPILSSQRLRLFALTGVGVGILAFLLSILAIWANAFDWGESYIKLLAISIIIAVAMTHTSLLLQIKNAASNVAISRIVTVSAIAVLAGILSVLIIAENSNDYSIRLIGAVSVVVVVGTVITFLLSKFKK